MRRLEEKQTESVLAADVVKRVPLLKRIAEDVVGCQERRRKAKEFLEELVVISRTFSSCEIEETINRLRREVVEQDRAMEDLEREVRLLGGFLKDNRRGLVYFYSEREGRRIFLVWDPDQPEAVSWHELDESFADRTLMDLSNSPDARASAID